MNSLCECHLRCDSVEPEHILLTSMWTAGGILEQQELSGLDSYLRVPPPL